MTLSKWKVVVVLLLLVAGLFGAGLGLLNSAPSAALPPRNGAESNRRADPQGKPKGEPSPPQAADLVRKVHQQQAWVHEVKSLALRFEGKHTSSPEAVEAFRAKLKKQLQGAEPSPKDHLGLRLEYDVRQELAFDGSRCWRRVLEGGDHLDLRIWDGKRAVMHHKVPGLEQFILEPTVYEVGEALFDNLGWLWNQPHTFWWNRPLTAEEKATRVWQHGLPEEFVVTGKAVYRGIPCHVLHRKGWLFDRWYVGAKTGLLHGRMHQTLPGNPEADRIAKKVAAAHGKALTTAKEFFTWYDTLERDKGNRIAEEYFAQVHPTDRPLNELWLLDYKEVQPGRWFPLTQGWASYEGTHAAPILSGAIELKAVEVKIDQPLADAAFKAPVPADGANVYDRTTDPPLFYKQKKDRTPAEWEALREEARKQAAEDAKLKAARDALIGKAALDFPPMEWLNGPALTWQQLKGKHVVLVFWAEWCGPCQGCVPLLRKFDGKSGVVVVGVHVPGSSRDEVAKALKTAESDGPVCIEPAQKQPGNPLGRLSDYYLAHGIPHAVLVDGQGIIAGHGEPYQMLRKAAELAAQGSK
jgi:thiol-disulfide isomerase/thioredoxin